MCTSTKYTVSTAYGRISVWDSQSSGPVALLLHGNSACKEVFKNQFESDVSKRFRLIAMDLPGHGRSENAKNPEETYSLPGYANVAIAVLGKLGIRKASVVGWSLGGHIAIDMLKRYPDIQGILITGTPPIPLTAEGFKQGFRPFPCLHLLGQEKFSKEEAETFVAQGGIDPQKATFMIEAALRTDGKARSNMIASMQKGIGGNQKQIVEESEKPIAVIAGSEDAGINNDYIQKDVSSKTLWKTKVHLIQGGHGVFWENSKKFNNIMSNFLDDINQSENQSSLTLQRNSNRKFVIGCVAIIAISYVASSIFKERNTAPK